MSQNHRLFHTIVLLGASMGGAACGGDLETPGGSGGAPSSDVDPPASGGSPVASSGGSVGGTVVLPSGGALTLGTGGTATGGAGGQSWSESDCPTEQMDCGSACAPSPTDCQCDALRPKSSEDCPPGYDFACIENTYWTAADAVRIRTQCECVYRTTYCDCPSGYNATGCDDAAPSPRTLLCNVCPVLLK